MRERYLYETRNAGVGADGPNRDLYQERLEMSGIAGTSYEPYKRVNHHRLQPLPSSRPEHDHFPQDPALHHGQRGRHPGGARQAGDRGTTSLLQSGGWLGASSWRRRETRLVSQTDQCSSSVQTELDDERQADPGVQLLLPGGDTQQPAGGQQDKVKIPV